MAVLNKVHSGLYSYKHYSIEYEANRWFVWDHNLQQWIADFTYLRDARDFLYNQE